MGEQSSSSRPLITAWQATTLRLTAFPDPSAKVTASTWWTDVLGGAPETSISKPRQGGEQQEGPLKGGKLILRIQPLRIDWVFSKGDIRDPNAETFPTLGSFPDALETFLPVMLRWFEVESCPPSRRLAFGAVLLQPAEDPKTGFQKIAPYLPAVHLDPEGSTDFSYQINRRRNSISGIASLEINRLSKWSVVSWQSVILAVSPAQMGYFPEGERYACQLDLDINTAPDFKDELPRKQMSVIFRELVALGKEIATDGDIP
jgi:hypothetical protein